jgi:hypothetical protein
VMDARKTIRDLKAFITENKILRLPEPDQDSGPQKVDHSGHLHLLWLFPSHPL